VTSRRVLATLDGVRHGASRPAGTGRVADALAPAGRARTGRRGSTRRAAAGRVVWRAAAGAADRRCPAGGTPGVANPDADRPAGRHPPPPRRAAPGRPRCPGIASARSSHAGRGVGSRAHSRRGVRPARLARRGGPEPTVRRTVARSKGPDASDGAAGRRAAAGEPGARAVPTPRPAAAAGPRARRRVVVGRRARRGADPVDALAGRHRLAGVRDAAPRRPAARHRRRLGRRRYAARLRPSGAGVARERTGEPARERRAGGRDRRRTDQIPGQLARALFAFFHIRGTGPTGSG
jgi:hypothetical protein